MTDIKPEYASTGIPYGYVNGFVPGPKPAVNLQNSYYPNPHREHSPFADTSIGTVVQDASNTLYQRTGEYQLQPVTYQQLPTIDRYIVAPGIQAPLPMIQHGWSQARVPQAGMHLPLPIHYPNLILSQPIHSDITEDRTKSITSLKHTPIKRRMKPVLEGNH
jgi:hypothetical protein